MTEEYWENLRIFTQRVFEGTYYGSHVIVSKQDAMKALGIRKMTSDRVHEIKEALRDRNVYTVYDDGDRHFLFTGKAIAVRNATRLIWS